MNFPTTQARASRSRRLLLRTRKKPPVSCRKIELNAASDKILQGTISNSVLLAAGLKILWITRDSERANIPARSSKLRAEPHRQWLSAWGTIGSTVKLCPPIRLSGNIHHLWKRNKVFDWGRGASIESPLSISNEVEGTHTNREDGILPQRVSLAYARLQNMKIESFVMPAWIAGIQVCRMRPETSMSAWIPALHAGMTESRSPTKTDRGPPPCLFSKETLSSPRVSIYQELFTLRPLCLRGEFSAKSILI